MFSSHHTKEHGFTLVEMIVSLAIFTLVAVVAVGALLKIVSANKKSHTMKTAMTNLNFALESISREMRVGTNYYCVTGTAVPVRLPNPGSEHGCNGLTGSAEVPWTVAFYSSKVDVTEEPPCNLIYAYQFNGTSLKKAEQVNSCNEDLVFSHLISDSGNQDVVLKFTTGWVKVVTDASGGVQPYAQFRFKGYAGSTEKVRSYFDVQTTVSQRLKE
jgi:prepilin-type N-terminal cleavage/methylation domain-containing protein